MKNKKFLLKAIFIIAMLSGCTTHHAHPIYIQNVQNVVLLNDQRGWLC